MVNAHNIINSGLFIPTPSTKIYFPNLYVQIHPKNQQNRIASARIVTKVNLPPPRILIFLSCLAYCAQFASKNIADLLITRYKRLRKILFHAAKAVSQAFEKQLSALSLRF